MPYSALQTALEQLPQALQQDGLWSHNAPTAAALASQVPFAADTLSIEQWLQFVLLPRLSQLLQQGLPLPQFRKGQGMSGMLELQWQQRGIKAPATLQLVAAIDRILEVE
ncbi:YqcC family protein [Parathalassolituus penaei]|uniref:YqcC family protein n=1 Tax=Parathalassolituus penaei TaxID=2997323 RepID=A0A9X3ISK2_9GAMM|nr:YqcC family protein [Parathalassolituus penaei]MCY0964253.1 YqcC family protein [Parathalassolituus penaei]